jgi:hypothetical protein
MELSIWMFLLRSVAQGHNKRPTRDSLIGVDCGKYFVHPDSGHLFYLVLFDML